MVNVFLCRSISILIFFLDDSLAVSRASLKFHERSHDNVDFPQSVIYLFTSCARSKRTCINILTSRFSLLKNYRSDRKSAIFVLKRFIFDILSTEINIRCTPCKSSNMLILLTF